MLELLSDFWKTETDYRCITTNGDIYKYPRGYRVVADNLLRLSKMIRNARE